MKKNVVMMVWNTCENDSRVIKEATTLASGGYDVTVVCLEGKGLPKVEERNGVVYRRVPVRVAALAKYVLSILAAFCVVLAIGFWLLISMTNAGRWLVEGGPIQLVLALLSLTLAILLAAPLVFLLGRATRNRIGRDHGVADRVVDSVARVAWAFARPALRVIYGFLYRPLVFRLVLVAMGRTVRNLSPSVIHAHDLRTLPAAARLARALDARLVYDSHELALEVSNPPRGLERWWAARHERNAIRRADRVITVSEGIAERLQVRYRVERPVILFNSPPAAERSILGRDVRSDLDLASDVPLAIYVGAPSHNRGLDVLVDALGELPRFHLACVGPRRKDWENRMRQRGSASGCETRLHFLDPVKVEDLLDYLSTADVGIIAYQNVCLNHEYCMPNKLFETALAGVPLVVANLRDLRSFVEEHGVGRAADETNPVALAKAIEEVAANEQYRPTGERLKRLRGQFGWEAQGERLLGLYAALESIDPAAGKTSLAV